MKYSSPQPPRWALRLLHGYCNPELLEEIQGDLYEVFTDRLTQRGLAYARLMYAWDVLKFIQPFTLESRNTHVFPASRLARLKSYSQLSARYLLKHRGFLAMNVLGLAIGIAACLIILHYVRFELGYDSFHRHADRICRVSAVLHTPETEDHIAPTVYGLAPALQERFPEVEAAVRFVPTGVLVKNEAGQVFNENYFFRADPNVFQVFTYPLLAGDPTQALLAPHSVVLTQALAKKYFGDTPPSSLVGTTLTVNHQEHTITGILQDVPRNSDLRLDALLSWQYDPNDWLELNSYTYLLLRDAAGAETLQAKLPAFDEQQVMPRIVQDWGSEDVTLAHQLHPLADLHYINTLLGDTEEKGNRAYVYIFSLAAICILLAACINYINLFIAQAGRRQVEVGVCKAMGASQLQLWVQYMSESFMTTALAIVLALGLVVLVGRPLADGLGEPLTWQALAQSEVVYALVGILVLVSLLAGSYPAFTLSTAHPVRALRGGSLLPHRRGRLRKVLIVLQFVVAISMIAGTLVVRQQVTYMRHKDLGFQQEQMLAISMPDDSAARQKAVLLKHALLEDSRIAGATIGFRPDALWSLSAFSVTAHGQTQQLSAPGFNVDVDYLEVLNLSLVAGRNFTPSGPNQIIVNEAFVKRVGWDQAVGQIVAFSETDQKEVVGVVQDFHYAPLHQKIEPLIIFYDTSVPASLMVNVAPQHLDVVRAAWSDFFPDFPLAMAFLNEVFDSRYRSELRMLTLFNYFSGLSIFIACVGLLGLTAFTVQQKTKEIGIRKVLGAGRVAIMYLLSCEFGLLLLLSVLIATPVAYVAMRFWLQNFAYQTDIDGQVFLLSAGGVALLALATLSYHTLRAAATNPVDSLRHE